MILRGPVKRAALSRPQIALAAATLTCWLTIEASNWLNPSLRRRNGRGPVMASA